MNIITGIKKLLKRRIIAKNVNTNIEIPEPYSSIISKIYNVAKKTGYKIYPVGGFVRDLVTGIFPKDLDILVDGPGDNPAVEFAKILDNYGIGRYVISFENTPTATDTTAAKFGVAKIIIDNIPVELVMPREESYSADSRKPSVKKVDITKDALRRDFTINTLMYDPETKKILDPTGKGIEDLKNDIIRSANPDVDTVFKDDPLRILRAIRFMITKDMEIDPETLEGMKRNIDRIKILSQERITDELKKIILADKPSRAIRLLKNLGLLKYILPELEETANIMEGSKYHLEEPTFEHILRTLDNIPPELTSRLAALLHDIGKPATRTIEEGVVHFFNHQNVGADMAREILKRLKFPNEIVENVSKLVKYHMIPHFYTRDQSDKSVRKFLIEMGDLLKFVLDLAEADTKGAGIDNTEALNKLEEFKQRLEKVKNQSGSIDQLTKPLINGYELQTMFNYGPGPWIKDVLNNLVDFQLENPNLTREEAENFVKEYVKLKYPDIFNLTNK